jgi:hypothetical protein
MLESSMMRTCAQMCLDSSPLDESEKGEPILLPTRPPRGALNGKIENARTAQRTACDGIPGNQCRKCGMPGQHRTDAECISALSRKLSFDQVVSALRDKLADVG